MSRVAEINVQIAKLQAERESAMLAEKHGTSYNLDCQQQRG